jgi:hypothetical protein
MLPRRVAGAGKRKPILLLSPLDGPPETRDGGMLDKIILDDKAWPVPQVTEVCRAAINGMEG